MGPGKHLHGVNLLDGAVDGKEFDYFHDMICSQEGVRGANRGFQDGNSFLLVSLNFRYTFPKLYIFINFASP
jgi:hypothetical protein